MYSLTFRNGNLIILGQMRIVSIMQTALDPKLSQTATNQLQSNHKECIYQRCPVCVQIADFQRWHKLGTGHHQKVEVQEELELLVQNLRGERRQGFHKVSEYVSEVRQRRRQLPKKTSGTQPAVITRQQAGWVTWSKVEKRYNLTLH